MYYIINNHNIWMGMPFLLRKYEWIWFACWENMNGMLCQTSESARTQVYQNWPPGW